MLGKTQLAWLKRTLLDSQRLGTTWKIVNVSDPIDQIGPISGTLNLVNSPTAAEYGALGQSNNVVSTADSTNKTIKVAKTIGLVVGQPLSATGVPARNIDLCDQCRRHFICGQQHRRHYQRDPDRPEPGRFHLRTRQ